MRANASTRGQRGAAATTRGGPRASPPAPATRNLRWMRLRRAVTSRQHLGDTGERAELDVDHRAHLLPFDPVVHAQRTLGLLTRSVPGRRENTRLLTPLHTRKKQGRFHAAHGELTCTGSDGHRWACDEDDEPNRIPSTGRFLCGPGALACGGRRLMRSARVNARRRRPAARQAGERRRERAPSDPRPIHGEAAADPYGSG
jgi:hypothetical protein